jgi:predicted nucleic acid-binding protein
LEIGAVPFLADDAQARRAGAERGLKVVGTVAILAAATRRGSLDFDEAVNRLGRTNFRAAPAVFAEVRRRLAEGESKPG